jgi:chromosome segregation ATPase
MDQLQELKTDNDTFINTTNTLESKIGDLTNSIAALKDEIIDKSNSLDIANRNNNNLQDQLSEYKEFKNENVTLKKQLEQVQEALNEKSTSVSTLINNIKQLEDKIKTDTDMISFYREQLDVNKEEKINLNNSLLEKEKSHKDELKELEKKSKLEIIELKESHKNSIAEKIEQLNSKCELELGKKDLEIEKLKNELERLNNKTVKTSKKIQDKE